MAQELARERELELVPGSVQEQELELVLVSAP